MQTRKLSSRREFIKLTALTAAGAAALAACGAPAASPTAVPAAPAAPAAAPAAAPTATTAAAAGAPTATTAAAAGAPTATTAAAAAAAPKIVEATGKLEIFSWWTSGGEVEALNALFDIYKKQNPKVEIVNSALTGGTSSGGNMKAVLATRIMGGDPPESFQIHLGHELLDNWVAAGKMEPLDFLYKDEGYDKVFPKSLIDIASAGGKPYSVPCNLHRANVLWYNTAMLKDVGADKAPVTWDDWFAIADKLKAKGISALGVAESAPGPAAQLFESILMGTQFFGAAGYRGLFDGTSSWSDKKITDALNLLLKMIPYFNSDYLSVAWGDLNDLMINTKVAFMVMGDWTPGVLWSKGFKDFGWGDCPGAPKVYSMLSDSFGLPKGVKNRDAAVNWLKVCGSKEGQEKFNLPKGSLPARTDADISAYTEYHKWAQKAWTDPTEEIVPSIVHGAAAKDSFNVDFQTAINVFVSKKDVAAAAAALVKAAKDAAYKV